MIAPRPYDIIVFGATGFTGGLTAHYLAQAAGRETFKWGIAGRNHAKLEEVKRRLVAEEPSAENIAVLHADVTDPLSLRNLVRQARVVITTVGPYIEYGEPLVKACVEGGADYVDLTGEPEFVDQMIDKYGEAAKAAGVRIVNCCGFDSIPHDLGALFTVMELRRRLEPAKADTTPITVEGFVRAKGTFSGGTLHSAVRAMAGFREHLKANAERRQRNPLSASARKVSGLPFRISHRKELGSWAVPMPTIDPEVVLRSARELTQFGSEFQYGHYARINRLPTLVGGGIGIGLVFAMAQLKPTRELLFKIKDPGQGPSQEQMEKSWFAVTFLGQAGEVSVQTEVRGGDPGYGETSKMLAESALCLALDREHLPEHVGVVTPASAMGKALIDRLQAAGITFRVIH